ncbi:MAG: MarR family winged helix-turn-helix transcriptional regulator [Pseudomonadota bacterium]
MSDDPTFDLKGFVPYLLNQAAEETSRQFETFYKARYGMLRTEWRVVFHLGRYGELTAKDICDRARLHKTKVSRAVHALEEKRYLSRAANQTDRRREWLSLTPGGMRVFLDLVQEAKRFDTQLLDHFTETERDLLKGVLTKLARLS